MATITIAQRFTESVYATKQEVKHELRTPLIDSFWKSIVTYRNGFAKPTGVYHFDHTPITYCLCPSISEKINNAERNINAYEEAYNMLSEQGHDRTIYHRLARIDVLNEVAKINELEVDDKLLSMIIDGNVSLDDEKYSAIENYARLLGNIDLLAKNNLDEDLLATLYARLTGSNELTNLYRITDESSANKVIIDRVYDSAPVHLIPGLVSDLLGVLNNDGLSSVVKAALAYYYVCFTKPFETHNEEMAVLLVKIVLAKEDNPTLMANLNLEKLFTFLDEKVKSTSIEVQKNYDLTYFLVLFLKLFEEQIDKEINRINHIAAEALKQDYYKDDLKEAKIETGQEESTAEPSNEIKEEEEIVNETKPVEQTEEVIEPVQDKKEIQEVISETKKEEPIQNVSINNGFQGLAISTMPVQLDESALLALTEDLIETDPELNRNQAAFYVRHCTMGKRYTIAQFKRELNCAYETARTSMDTLARLGYYRQEMVKNKKVYTPIKRK